MRIINTKDLTPQTMPSNNSERLWLYNGLDCCVTYEVLEKLLVELDDISQPTYNFERALQGPILEMNMRGVLIDIPRRDALIKSYLEDIEKLTFQLNRIIREGFNYDFPVAKTRRYSFPSDDQFKYLFYDVMKLPVIRRRNEKGELVPTINRAALEKLERYFDAEPIIRHLLVLRDLGKKVSFLSTAVDPDNRLRTSFNIAGTTTGRLASSFSDFGTGTNLQNIENRLRAIFIPDKGFKFGNIDLEQSDSRVVGAIQWNLFRDSRYLDACESGDLHTSVSRLTFDTLSWTGERTDRELADAKFYRNFSYRDAAKRLGHGTNYQGEPETMSRETKIPITLIKAFQPKYLSAFPAFHKWWAYVSSQLSSVHRLTTILGRQRYFFGNAKDPEVIRAAIAYEPQSTTADTIDRGLLAIWRSQLPVQLLLQVHDSILFQYPEEQEEIIPAALKMIEQTQILKGGREFTIPAEAKTGYNWSDNKDDEQAMKKFCV